MSNGWYIMCIFTNTRSHCFLQPTMQTVSHLCDEPTLPTSTRLVTMTIEAVFSCQTILQKSLTVSCMGPGTDTV